MWGEALHGAWEKGAGALRGAEGSVEKGSVVEPDRRNLREFFDGTFEESIGFLERKQVLAAVTIGVEIIYLAYLILTRLNINAYQPFVNLFTIIVLASSFENFFKGLVAPVSIFQI